MCRVTILLVLSTLAGGPMAKPQGIQPREVIFHIGGQDLFDKTLSFKREGKVDGKLRVVVDLDAQETWCPIEMARWAQGGRGACQLEFRFRNDSKERDYWLHVRWRGSSFEVLANGAFIARSTGTRGPSGWQEEKFRVRVARGRGSILLRLASRHDKVILHDVALCTHASLDSLPLGACPTSRTASLGEYEEMIRQPGLMLDGRNVRLFAPLSRKGQAKQLHAFLEHAARKLAGTAGGRGSYKIIVATFPDSSPHCLRRADLGTATILHGYELLETDNREPWTRSLDALLGELKRVFPADATVLDAARVLREVAAAPAFPPCTARAGEADRSRFAMPPGRNDAAKRTYTREVLFHIGGDDLFDKTLSYAIRKQDGERCVTVDLGAREIHCPIEIGRRTGAGVGAETLELVFPNRFGPGTYRLHVVWQTASGNPARFELIGNGKRIGRSRKDPGGARNRWQEETFPVKVARGENRLRLVLTDPETSVRFKDIALCTHDSLEALPRPACPTVRVTTRAEFEHLIREAALILDGKYTRLFAPRSLEKQARIIFPYIEKGYEAFHELTGLHTNYKVVVYASPGWSPWCWGGTATGAAIIPYSYGLLDLEKYESWRKHRVPRLLGVFEEMGHCFTLGLGTRFGTESIGAFLSGTVGRKVTGTPVLGKRRKRGPKNTYTVTMRRYIDGGYRFPADIPNNLCDRIYVEILYRAEQAYGPNFWRDFFTEFRKVRPQARNADVDTRHRLTVGSFDRLPGLDFRRMLREYRISEKTSLATIARQRNWDRRFIPPDERRPGDYPDK